MSLRLGSDVALSSDGGKREGVRAVSRVDVQGYQVQERMVSFCRERFAREDSLRFRDGAFIVPSLHP